MRILLVEDEMRIADFLMRGLKEEMYAVDHAKNGEKAFNLFSVHTYDLIITDIMMPVLDGFGFITKVRDTGSNIPIIVLTARDSTDDKINGLDCGADDYLTKPFSFNELLARIRVQLRRNSTTLDKLSISDLVLDPVTHVVTRDSKRISLSAKEYSLLEFLLRNKGRVLTRTNIIEHVWDMNFNSDTNIVDVFISYLRKKIEVGFKSRLIKSIRGVGYILEEEL